MAQNYGKKFEVKFKEDFKKIPNSSIDRIYDTTNGFSGIKNICDFIAYVYPNIFYFECKSIKGNTFPLSNLKQYDKLLAKKGIKGVNSGVVIWFYEKDKVVYVPIETFEKIKKENKKSYNLKEMLNNKEYRSIDIPSIKKRTFMDSDYTVLLNMEEYNG